MYRETLVIALREIRRNVMRSFLTILGIIIGVSAVITMVTIGSGTTAKVTADISKLGSNLLTIRPGQMRGPGGASAGAEPFKYEDVKAIASEISMLEAVAPSSSATAVAVYGNENWSTTVMGTNNEYFKARDWNIPNGRQFADGELRSGKAVCIVGETVRRELFGGQDPVGSTIRIQKISCQVIGVLEAKGHSSFGSDQDDVVLMPLQTFQRRIAGSQDINRIYVSVEEDISTETAERDITLLLRERRRISPNEEENFSVMDMKDVAATLTGVTQVLTALLSAIAAVSLLVGGIGIMNIMLVSVTERTREIGIRLAIGALEQEVLTQFLVEAVVLSSFGGIFGIILAVIASFGLTRVLGVPYIMDPGIILIAFLFSAAVGVIFGYLPARKAARLNPIDALRYE
ncbi:MAG: ABC transporter permease [Thermodesulfovibrionales bacterium]|nr:ABC transporter permease [Thermodesulfovibrionales bacterium]